MLETTKNAIRAMLKADATLTADNRRDIINAIGTVGQPPPMFDAVAIAGANVVKRKEVAKMLGRSVRLVDMLAQTNALRRVKLPGRKRGCGFLLADVVALIK
jgi:hypothetical protein